MEYRFHLETENTEGKWKKILKETAILFLEIIIVIVIAYLLASQMFEKTSVIGTAMEPTLKADDTVIINRFAYLLGKPKRFDVIVFKQSDKEHSYYDMKRVIGLPGETVQITDGKIYINGSELEETIQVETVKNGGLASDSITLDENEYFVLGDNRNQSEDSRFASIGNIVKNDIIGKAWITWNPFNFISAMNQEKKEEIQRQE